MSLQSLPRKFLLLVAGLLWQGAAVQAEPVEQLKVTLLSTMLAGPGIGEWGFAALVEVDGYQLLLDTGSYPDTVLRNAEELGIDLASVEEVILTHNHGDHTGGLLQLREQLQARNPAALSRAHVGEGIFRERASLPPGWLPPAQFRAAYEALGGSFQIHAEPVQIRPGVWLTGNVPRVHEEQNYPLSGRLLGSGGEELDTIPEDMSLVIETAQGLLLISGCGHAGIINTMEHARSFLQDQPVLTAIGGFHLLAASPRQLRWTGDMMSRFGVREFIGAHCTGVNAVFALRETMGLAPQNAVIGSIGTLYELGGGITPGPLESSAAFEGF